VSCAQAGDKELPKTFVEPKSPERSLIISYVTLNAADNQTIFVTDKKPETIIELSPEEARGLLSIKKTKHNELVLELPFYPTTPYLKGTTSQKVGDAILSVNESVSKPLDLRIYLPFCWRNLLGLVSILKDALEFASRLETISLQTIRASPSGKTYRYRVKRWYVNAKGKRVKQKR